LPVPARPYRSLVLAPAPAPSPTTRASVPHVAVERRELSAYAALAAGGEA